MLGVIALTETTFKLWKYVLKKCWKLVTNKAFKYFRGDRQHTYWSVITFRCICNFLENWSNTNLELWYNKYFVTYAAKRFIILREFNWEISFLYCFWGIADVKLFCNICKSPLKIIKNAFCFTLIALFILRILKVLSWCKGHVEKWLN